MENSFMQIIDKRAPLKKRRIGEKQTPWITKQLLEHKWQKNYLKKKACKTKDSKDRIIYKEVRNRNNRPIKSIIRCCYTKELQQNKANMKGTRNSLNSLINKQSKSVNVMYVQGDSKKEIKKDDIPNAFDNGGAPDLVSGRIVGFFFDSVFYKSALIGDTKRAKM